MSCSMLGFSKKFSDDQEIKIMRTIKEWNKIIENYFNENNIEYDRNYLCFLPENNFIKVLFDKKI